MVVGASPSSSTTSKARVFWPSRRWGFTEFTRATGKASVSFWVRRRASSKFPSTWTILAPCTRLWATLPKATYPAGRTTMAKIPALAA